MIRRVLLASVLWVLVAAAPADLFAQFNPYGNRSHSYAWSGDPRLCRAYREQAVAIIGPRGREFVEMLGEDAVAAIFACSRPVAVKLAELYNSGELRRLPRPRDLLCVIAQPGSGDDVALFAIYHVRELSDPDGMDAYLMNPLEYAMGLKNLAVGAAEMRVRRINVLATTPPPAAGSLSAFDKVGIFCCVAFLAMLGFVLWRRRQSAIC